MIRQQTNATTPMSSKDPLPRDSADRAACVAIQRRHAATRAAIFQAELEAQANGWVVGWAAQHGPDEPWDGLSMVAIPPVAPDRRSSDRVRDGGHKNAGRSDRGSQARDKKQGGSSAATNGSVSLVSQDKRSNGKKRVDANPKDDKGTGRQ